MLLMLMSWRVELINYIWRMPIWIVRFLLLKKYVVKYIGLNVNPIRYACTCTFHAKTKYKCHSRVDHATYTCTWLIDMYQNSCYAKLTTSLPLPLLRHYFPSYVKTPTPTSLLFIVHVCSSKPDNDESSPRGSHVIMTHRYLLYEYIHKPDNGWLMYV